MDREKRLRERNRWSRIGKEGQGEIDKGLRQGEGQELGQGDSNRDSDRLIGTEGQETGIYGQ